jgi:hypothetical protein
MKPLRWETFDAWLEAYGRASRENDPHASAELFAQNAEYYETPFDPPMLGRDAIRKYWEAGARALKDKESEYEILALQDNLGIARWKSMFTEIASGRRLALDCLFLVAFDDNDLCRTFREWWHLKSLPVNPEK